MDATSSIEPLISRIARQLVEVPGIVGVVLGGSHARGASRPDSDVDLGLYYQAASPPDIPRLHDLARTLDDRGIAADVTKVGEWGPWVNGGGWLEIEGVAVDWLYRDLDRVSAVIDQCVAGQPTCDYYLGHPHGFHNHIYLGEIHHARILVDPMSHLSALKARVALYPPALRRALVQRYLYDATFMLRVARRPAQRGDVFHVSGCLFRSAAALVQVIYALNERYFLNEKGALQELDRFPLRPEAFSMRVESILGAIGRTSDPLVTGWTAMNALIEEARELVRVDAA